MCISFTNKTSVACGSGGIQQIIAHYNIAEISCFYTGRTYALGIRTMV